MFGRRNLRLHENSARMELSSRLEQAGEGVPTISTQNKHTNIRFAVTDNDDHRDSRECAAQASSAEAKHIDPPHKRVDVACNSVVFYFQ